MNITPMMIYASLVLNGTICLMFPEKAREIIKQVVAENDPVYGDDNTTNKN